MKSLFIVSILMLVIFASCEKREIIYDPGVQLEENNFKVDSKDWPTVVLGEVTFKIYSPNDNDYVIIEFVSGVADYLIGQQLFSKTAALDETSKAGKQLPTSYEIDSYLETVYGKGLNQTGGLVNVNTDVITGLIRPGFVTIGLSSNNNSLELSNFNMHDLYRGFCMWSGNGSLSLQILDRGISRNNFTTDRQLYLLSVRCKKNEP